MLEGPTSMFSIFWKKPNSGTKQRTEMADHLLESLGHKKDKTAAYIFLGQRITTENYFIHLKVVCQVQLNANITILISRVYSEYW